MIVCTMHVCELRMIQNGMIIICYHECMNKDKRWMYVYMHNAWLHDMQHDLN